ncbi:hypothetical protein FBULB1_277 [Fusarium bulbicola]|nr:hypothetical protein FBULB1_277 [Fusarium bulbicola]
MDITTVDTRADDMPRVGDKILQQVFENQNINSGGVFRIELFHHSPEIVPCHNGFIWAATEIYDGNSQLTIRVDDIWLAILAQLKPEMAEFRKTQNQYNTAIFTTEQLNNSAQVAQRLSDTVKKRFDDEKRQVLMPHFSTTTPEDTTSAALLLLGAPCPTIKQRVLKPEEPDYAKHVMVDDFWKDMLKVDHNKQLTGGWLRDFLRPPRGTGQPALFLNNHMPSAVAALPILFRGDQGSKPCKMIGGLLGYSRWPDVMDTRDPRIIAQPISGWMVYDDIKPREVIKRMADQVQE